MSRSTDRERLGATFWVGLALGGGVMLFGLRGVFIDAAGTRPGVLLRWVIGADLVHDFLVAPFVIAVGWVIVRIAPRTWRVPVQAGLAASGVALIVGWAAWRGYGRDTVPDNPTVQPLDYTTAILTVWGIVWTVVAIWITTRVLRARGLARRGRRATTTVGAATSRDHPGTVPRP